MGIFEKFKNGLAKTRDMISSGFKRIAANMGHFDADMLDELEMLLIQADCGMQCTGKLMDRVKNDIRTSGNDSTEAVLTSLRAEMLEMLSRSRKLQLNPNGLTILLMVGVNGTGKTTSSGKIAQRYRKEGKKVLLVAADTFRAAAVEQLKIWGERCDTPVIAHEQGSDPAAVVYDGIKAAISRKVDLLIIDTAGRLHSKQNLMDELSKIKRIVSREAGDALIETILVLDATSGQNALAQAKAFSEATAVSGVLISKLDGNAKGGVALAVAEQNALPLMLAGLGEQADDLQDFSAEDYVASLLPNNL